MKCHYAFPRHLFFIILVLYYHGKHLSNQKMFLFLTLRSSSHMIWLLKTEIKILTVDIGTIGSSQGHASLIGCIT